MIKLKNLMNESFGIGELPSSKLMKMKVSFKDMLDSVNESVEPQIKKIAELTGVAIDDVEKYVSSRALNITKLLQYIKDEKQVAIRGFEKAVRNDKTQDAYFIKMFNESDNEESIGSNYQIGSKVEVVLSNQILDFLQQRNLITGGNAQLIHKELTAFIKNNLNADVTEGNQIKVGTIVRYKKGDGFSSGKIKSISLDKADIHNGDGSTTTLPLKDLEYVESWNN